MAADEEPPEATATASRLGKRGLKLLDRTADTLALGALVAMVLVVSWQVFGRFVLLSSPRWTSEVSLLLIGWLGFLGVAIGIREGSHIAVGYFADKLPAMFQPAIDRLGPLLMVLFGGYLVVQGWDFTQLMMANTMPATGLPRAWQYAAMPVSGVLVVLYGGMQLLGLDTVRDIGTSGASSDLDEGPDEVIGSAS